jgi:phenylpyruvate tautomerase PptA (4-oxalocrotonate tautomerase family)
MAEAQEPMKHLTRTHEEKQALAKDVVDYLNELMGIDPALLHALIETRLPCSQALSDHPTAQAGGTVGAPTMGLLGILNGLVGVREDHYGYITAVYEEADKLASFTVTPEYPVPGHAQGSPIVTLPATETT